MNPLELLKDKLRVKPIIEEHEMVPISVPNATTQEKVEISKVTFVDERNKDTGFSRKELEKRLKENRMATVVLKPTIKASVKSETEQEPETPIIEKKKAKKISKSLGVLRLVGEEEEEKREKTQEEKLNEAEEKEEEVEKMVEEKEEMIEEPKKRRTKRPTKGVTIIPPEEWVDIDKMETIARLPPKKPKVNIKVSSYFMNNREKFVNFINSLFGEYRDEVMDDNSQISCDSIGKKSSGEFNLLTHQKLVRDYLNLYTPYRGLLLYFGLGAGKTCTSIAIAEGFKSNKKIIVMTPASLRRNYIEELKKCGDSIYKKNQFWQWVSTREHPNAIETLSSVLNLSVEYINKKKGAWLINTTKPSNYDTLEASEIKSLDEQIDEMIQYKYKFINYNGLRRDKLKNMTDNFETNFFDDSVIIIDEAHNFISRIVNKIAKEKEIPVDNHGKKERVPYSLALILYEMLLSAKNARIVLLTGTPIINYPNEIGILFNILRGYIKTWEIPLDIRTGQSVTKEKLQELFAREKILDYIDYSKDKVITVTRNPFGFENKYKTDVGFEGVTNKPKQIRGDDGKTRYVERGTISDMDFERRIISILENNKIGVNTSGIKITLQKALPDKFDNFVEMFVNVDSGETKNMELFKRRIIGLTSYFKSAQESLMPKYEKLVDFHVIKIPMSDYQFTVYEAARVKERKQESSSKPKKGGVDENGIYKDASSTYRIFSRLYCNFAMPRPPGRPMPREEKEEETQQVDDIYADALKESTKKGTNDLEGEAWDGELEGDEVIEKLADATYEKRIQRAVEYLKEHESEILTHDGLQIYSPKYLNILENIQDPKHIGLHLVYSQFRTLEGIGIFKMVLDANGFTQFKIKKDSSGVWELDISEENRGKPTYALYTGTESAEEKEMIRNIYNSDWDVKSPITKELKEIAHNNNMGEIIKVLMITASGSEGINLRSTRYVHIMEPYWNPTRIDQVVGRARRICSHKELPDALQTVEVFLYLMTFSKKQIDPKNDSAIELKRKDKSKRKYKVIGDDGKEGKEDYLPLTSDEALFEISNIKENVSFKLLTAVKEASIDCAIYSKRGSKEQLNCLQFGEPSSTAYSYIPNYKKEEPDTTKKINKKPIEWRGKPYEFRGKKYIYRTIDKINGNLYDWDSYHAALENPQIEPVLVATAQQTPNGLIVKQI
uniref:Helicase ATP-binding domain-containing protein n=1 Tax=viral metagenome TaxID=1070528 RepID=A0A6C0D8W8_9ZZZZ